MTTEQEKDAVRYIDTAVAACRRRLDLLDDARARGAHDEVEYMRLRTDIIQETEDAWHVSLKDYFGME